MKITRTVNGKPVNAKELAKLGASNPTLAHVFAAAEERLLAKNGRRR